MSKKIWLRYLGAALLATAPPLLAAGRPPAIPASTPTAKKKTTKAKRKPKSITQQAPTPDRIREIQLALIREGALSGAPTGKWDAATVGAMQKYQTNNGLAPTGKVDALTLQKLGLGSEIAGKAAPTPPASSGASSPAARP